LKSNSVENTIRSQMVAGFQSSKVSRLERDNLIGKKKDTHSMSKLYQ